MKSTSLKKHKQSKLVKKKPLLDSVKNSRFPDRTGILTEFTSRVIINSLVNLLEVSNTKISQHNKNLKTDHKNIILENKELLKNKHLHSASVIDLTNELRSFIKSIKYSIKFLRREKITDLKNISFLKDIKKNIYSLLSFSEELNYLNSLYKISLEKINLYVFYHTIFSWLKPYYRKKKVKLELQFSDNNIPLVLGNKDYLKKIIEEILSYTSTSSPKKKIIFKVALNLNQKVVITEINNINITPEKEPKKYILKYLKKQPLSGNFWRLAKIKQLIKNANQQLKIFSNNKNSKLTIVLPIVRCG